MDDDEDDYFDVDIDQIVQAHATRGSGQNGTQAGTSQGVRAEAPPVLTGPQPLLSGAGGLQPPYFNQNQSNINGSGMATSAMLYNLYSGQPPRPPQVPGGSLFQDTHFANRTGGTHALRPQYNAGNTAAAASSTSSGATVHPLPSGGPAAVQAGAGAITCQGPQAPSATTLAGPQPLSKPRSLGQQLGFGAAGAGPTAGSGTQGAPGGYSALLSNSISAVHNSAGPITAPGASHMTGTYGPVGAGGPVGAAAASTSTRDGAQPASAPALAVPVAPAGPGAITPTNSTTMTGPIGGAGMVSAAPSNGPANGPNPSHPAAVPAPPQTGLPYWTSTGAAVGGSPAPSMAQAPGVYPPQLPPLASGLPAVGRAGIGIGSSATAVAGGIGPYITGGAGGAGSSFSGGAGAPAPLHAQGPDVNALRVHNNALEAQIEALKRQLQESMKLAKGAQSLQEQLQHVQSEAQELQRKNREAFIRLQEERCRGEVAERERKEAQDKCLMLEAEMHKARASSSAVGPMRTPPPKQGASPGAGGGTKRPRHGHEPYAFHHSGLSTQLHRQQPSPLPQQQQQQQQHDFRDAREVADGELAREAAPTGGPRLGLVAAAAATEQQQQQQQQQQPRVPDGSAAASAAVPTRIIAESGSSPTAAATAAPPSAFSVPLFTALEDIQAARLPLWQRLWCACPNSLTILLHPTSPASAVAAAAAAAAAAEEGWNDSPRLLAAAAATAMAVGLAPLPGFRHTGSQLSQPSQMGFTQAVIGLRSNEGDGGSDSGGGGVGVLLDLRSRCVGLVEVVRIPLRLLSTGRGDGTTVLLGVFTLLQAATAHLGGEVAAVPTIGGRSRHRQRQGDSRPDTVVAVAAAAAAAEAAGDADRDDTQPYQEQDSQQAVGNREQELVLQQAALWPLVGPCVDLLAGLLTHSEACRKAISTATTIGNGATQPASLSLHVKSASAATAAPPTSTASTAPPVPNGRCNWEGELRRGGLPYLLPPPGNHLGFTQSGGAANCAAAAAMARAERRRQLRGFIYGNTADGDKGPFESGGSSALDTERRLQPDCEQQTTEVPVVADGVDTVMREACDAISVGGEGATDRTAVGTVFSLEEIVRVLMAVAVCCDQDDRSAGIGVRIGEGFAAVGAAAAATARASSARLDVLRCVAAALSAIGIMLPAASSRKVLLSAILDPLHLLVPLLCHATAPPRLAAVSLLHLLLENPTCVATAATALGVPGYAPDHHANSPDPHHTRGQLSLHRKLLEPAAAIQLFTALLDGLEPDAWGQEGPSGWSGISGRADAHSTCKLPRLVLALLAMLLETGHDALVGALCCPPWLEGYGLPLRLLALADAACSPPGSEDPLEPVYPSHSNPAFEIVAGACVRPAEWLQRLLVAQEALILLKELLTGGSEDTRRAALQDLASTSPDSDSQQLVELATSRLVSWPRCPQELLQTAIGQEAGLVTPELAPWAARITLGGGGAGGGRTGVGPTGRGVGAGRGGNSGVAVVVCSVEAVGALAGSVRRRWQHWQLQQQQAWQQIQQHLQQ